MINLSLKKIIFIDFSVADISEVKDVLIGSPLLALQRAFRLPPDIVIQRANLWCWQRVESCCGFLSMNSVRK